MLEGHQAIINSKLNSFLSASRLSMSQLAQKLEISKSHLSEIKNGKKDPHIDLGLKILKHCGASTIEKQEWIEQKYLSQSAEYEEHHHNLNEGLKRERLSNSIADKLSKDLDSINIFLDITAAKEIGVSKSYIQHQYGLSGIRKIKFLIEANLISEKCGSYFASANRLVMTKNASYELLKTVTCDQQNRFHQGELDGKFKFQIDDIDEEGYQQLNLAFENYMKEVNSIVKNHSQPPQEGGKRYFIQSMVGLVKNTFFCALLFILIQAPISFARDGGMEGGSSSLVIPNFENEYQALEYGFKLEETLNGPTKEKVEKEILSKHCTKLVNFNRAADAKVQNVKVSPYWENKIKKFELKVNLKVKCIGDPFFRL